MSAGIVIDIIGVRYSLAFALVISAIGNYLIGYADQPGQLIDGRCLIGFANAFILVGVYKTGAVTLTKRYFSIYVGILLGVTLLVNTYIPSQIALLINNYQSWQSFILIMNILGVILALLVTLFVNDRKIKIISLDEILYVLSSPTIWLISVIALFGFLLFSGTFDMFGMMFFRQVLHFTKQQASTLVNCATVGFAIGAVLTGISSAYMENKKMVLSVGYFLASIAFLVVLYSLSLSYAMVLWLLILTGFCIGSRVITYVLVNECTSPSCCGFAFSILMYIGIMGGAVISPLLYYLTITAHANTNISTFSNTTTNWTNGLIVIPIALIVGGILTLFLRKANERAIVSQNNIIQEMKGYWQGHGCLGRAYWLLYVLGSLIVGSFFYPFLMAFGSSIDIKIIIEIFLLAYLIFASICVWRCGNNASWGMHWKYVARIIVIINIVMTFLLAVAAFISK